MAMCDVQMIIPQMCSESPPCTLCFGIFKLIVLVLCAFKFSVLIHTQRSQQHLYLQAAVFWKALINLPYTTCPAPVWLTKLAPSQQSF